MLPVPPAALVRLPLRWLPDALNAELFTRAFNFWLRGQRLGTQLEALEGKSVCLHVTDADRFLRLRIAGGQLHPAGSRQTDVTIRGSTEDFLALATRCEDPDSLFFHRRLAIEGDTEIALTVKNLLDAFEYDWEAHFRDVLGPKLATLLTPLGRHLARLIGPSTARDGPG